MAVVEGEGMIGAEGSCAGSVIIVTLTGLIPTLCHRDKFGRFDVLGQGLNLLENLRTLP